jgi:DNA-binding SARP family transcriptional activator/predicted ATPase
MMNRISMLGPMSVTIGGEPRHVGAPKQRAVLAQLALEPGMALSADRLLDEVWGDRLPSGAAKAVAFQITKLRDVLEPDRNGEGTFVRTTPGGYVLDIDARHIDVHDVSSVIDDAGRAIADDPVKAQFLAEDALAMWRGRPFADIPESRSVEEEARRLGLLHDRAQRLLFEARVMQGDHDEVLADVARYVERHPLDEAATALLMRALDNAGRTAEALRAFSGLRRRLVEELGLDPSPELADLEMSILTRERVETAAPAPTSAPTAVASELPQPVTSLVGRDGDVAAILERLGEPECRVLTLTGPGGIGKSRLAIEVAHRWDGEHGPARFVGLASHEGGGIAEVVAESIGFVIDQYIVGNGLSGRMQLLDFLALQRGLLVLDNYEHLLREVDFVEEVAERCADITVLVTSRERLNIPAEWSHHVAGLSVDGPDPGAARLFLSRSQQVGAVLSAADREHVQRLCVATEGMPLALELCAAVTPVMTVADIADQVESNAAELSTDMLGGVDRHRSLHASFEQSWSMLDPTLQRMLARLAVFGGSFTGDATEQVAGVGRSSLARLQMKSLLRRSGSDRFDLHPLVRQFALSKLDDVGAARTAHAIYFAGLLEYLRPTLLGSPDQMAAVAAADEIIDDLRAAATWFASNLTVDGYDERLLGMLHGLSAYWFVRSFAVWAAWFRAFADTIEDSLGLTDAWSTASYRWGRAYHGYSDSMATHDEVAPMLGELRQRLDDLAPQATAWCLVGQAVCAESAGDIELALELMEEAAAIPHDDDPLLHALVTSWHGWEASQLGRHDEAGEIWRRGLAHAEQAQNQTARAYLLSKVGVWAEESDEHEIAMQCHRDSAELFRRTGDHGGLGYTLSRLSWTCRLLGDFDAAIGYAEAALEEFRQVNHRWGIGASLGRMAHAHLDAGHPDLAARRFRECLDWGDQTEMPTIVCYGLAGISLTLVAVSDDERAAVLFAHSVGIAQNPYLSAVCRPGLAGVGERLAPERLEAATERGRSLDMTEAVLFARHCADEIAEPGAHRGPVRRRST